MVIMQNADLGFFQELFVIHSVPFNTGTFPHLILQEFMHLCNFPFLLSAELQHFL